ncbi:MAG: chromate transporter [Parvibaculaceae bacterium]|nr:chromate transporter [Parvibaculaceae bacterium]
MSVSRILINLLTHFGFLSLVAFGGGNAVLPEMHRMVVEQMHWMSDGDFSRLFAVAQAAPGPNVLMVTLIGWKMAGLAGALVATLAMIVPSSVAVFSLSRLWMRYEHTRITRALREGVVPVTLGFIAAGGLLLAKAADTSWPFFCVTVAAALFTYATKYNPLWALGGAALLGIAGVI